MSQSQRQPWLRFQLTKYMPWLFVKCLGGNLHYRWRLDSEICYCMSGTNGFGPLSLRQSVEYRKKGQYWPDGVLYGNRYQSKLDTKG